MRGLAHEDLGKSKLSESELSELQSAIEWHLRQAALRQQNTASTQHEIFDIQKEKQEIMAELKRQLSCLDNPQCILEKTLGDRETRFNPQKKIFEYEHDGKVDVATFGEIMTDMEWDVFYHLDKAFASRSVIKKYLVERAKHKLGRLLDFQIIASESDIGLVDKFKKGAYKAYCAQFRDKTMLEKAGFVAESMVKNILRKMSYDTGADFDIFSGDVFQDVEQKIDFIIHKKQKFRGVNVAAEEQARDIGVQFTINPDAREHKIAQIRRAKQGMITREDLDDLVLVVIPMQSASELMREWRARGMPAGGPDKLMTRKGAGYVIREVLNNIIPQEEINLLWQKFAQYFQKK